MEKDTPNYVQCSSNSTKVEKKIIFNKKKYLLVKFQFIVGVHLHNIDTMCKFIRDTV